MRRLNACFSALLRALGFKLSEVCVRRSAGLTHQYGARVFANRNQAPEEAGYAWTPISHMVLLVDLPDGPWLVDVGFGGTSSLTPQI